MHSGFHYQQWYQVFEWIKWIIDLPHLNFIKLGKWALYGSYDDDDCSLMMESNIDMNKWMDRSS